MSSIKATRLNPIFCRQLESHIVVSQTRFISDGTGQVPDGLQIPLGGLKCEYKSPAQMPAEITTICHSLQPFDFASPSSSEYQFTAMDNIQTRIQHLGIREENEFIDLPWAIICNIVSRLPVRSIGVFMCVSKSFHCINKDPYFIELQINNATCQPRCFVLKESLKFGKCGKDLYIFDEGKPKEKPTKILIADVVGEQNMRLVGSCNGLLCLSSHRVDPPSESIVIYNPITTEYMTLPTIFDNMGKMYFCGSISFGFDAIFQKYKVVIIYPCIEEVGGLESIVITLGEGSWRRLNLPHELQFKELRAKSSIFSNGSLYWIMEKKIGSTLASVIFSMDINNENFQDMGLNDPPFQNGCIGPHDFLVSIGKSLALAVHNKQNGIDMWILVDTKRGIWSYQATHDLACFVDYKKDPEKHSCQMRGMIGDDSLLVEYEYDHGTGEDSYDILGPELQHLVCYTPGDRRFGIDFRSYDIPFYFSVFPFVPSLVSPKNISASLDVICHANVQVF
ncbi:hypothetical protein ACHQM5_004193 [Ranunculus cassubicifolius]